MPSTMTRPTRVDRPTLESRHTCHSLAVRYLRQYVYMTTMSGGRIGNSQEGPMCPACIVSTAVMVAAGGSTGGILAACIGKFRKFFRANRLGLFSEIEG